jgi:hypothetical protein
LAKFVLWSQSDRIWKLYLYELSFWIVSIFYIHNNRAITLHMAFSMTNKSNLGIILCGLLISSYVGCVSTPASTRAGLVKPKFESTVPDPRRLLMVHVVEAPPVEIAERLGLNEASRGQIQRSLAEALQATLSFDVKPSQDKALKGRRIDARLNTKVFEFVDRLGSSVGVERPARVGFEMQLVNPQGAVLWSSRYFVNEEGVFDNLLKLGERVEKGQPPRWHASQELIAEGFALALADLDDKRMAQYRAKPLE